MKMHTCCASKHSYHKGNCPVKGTRVPGRASDTDFIQVQNLKADGLTSIEVAKRINMPLEQVNDLWVL